MYCGACAHDALLLRDLRRLGADAVAYPLYTHLKLDGTFDFPQRRIYLGGIKAYLQHRWRLFRTIPDRWLGWLDDERLLRWASRFAVSTKPSELGPMTLDTLRGASGPLAGEFRRLAEAVDGEAPDAVTVTNSMLSGAAPLLRAPVACFLQGEDSFLEALPEPYRGECIRQIRLNASAVRLFIAPCEDHRQKMLELLGCEPERVKVVRAGVDVPACAPRRRPGSALTVGYLSSILPGKGLDLLLEAAKGLGARLLVAGKVLDRRYFHRLNASRFEYQGELRPSEKSAFFERIDVFCLPSRIRESRGIAVLEALAHGVPAVVPELGVFKEIAARTGAAELFVAGSVDSLRSALKRLSEDRARLEELAFRAQDGVRTHYDARATAEQTLALLEELRP